MSRPLIRPMLRPDLPQVQSLFAANNMLNATQLRRVFNLLSDTPGAIHLVAETEGRIVGALLAQCTGIHVFLTDIAVDHSCRRQGVGRRLHKELERRAKKLKARGVIADARMSAVGFYERLEYKIPGAVFLIRRFEE